VASRVFLPTNRYYAPAMQAIMKRKIKTLPRGVNFGPSLEVVMLAIDVA